MLFWLIAAMLTLGACLAVLAPMSRRSEKGVADEDHDLEVYRDQLAELEREAARGTIDTTEADQARAEIGRRILRLTAERPEAPSRGWPTVARVTTAAAVLSIPLVSWGLYATFGSPDLPDQPLQARLERNPAEASMAELVARAEAHLAQNPSDARGWEVLAPVYLRMGRGGDAAVAFRNVIRLDGETAPRLNGLGQALVAASGGLVNVDAQRAFERALEFEPGNPHARYFLATAHMQEGRRGEAAALWQAMVAELPGESPWRRAAEEALEEAGQPVPPAARGPTSDQVEAAATLGEDERAAMIEDMVASLDTRLRAEPNDAEGWQQLIRSYVVLGRHAEALDALDRGLAAIGRDSETGGQLVAFAEQLGLDTGEEGR